MGQQNISEGCPQGLSLLANVGTLSRDSVPDNVPHNVPTLWGSIAMKAADSMDSISVDNRHCVEQNNGALSDEREGIS